LREVSQEVREKKGEGKKNQNQKKKERLLGRK
jgi:hypothetical protein